MPAPASDRLIIFTRYPQTGSTKTRMIPVLGAEGAAELQRLMTEHTLDTARSLARGLPLEIEVHFEGGDCERMRQWLGSDVAFQRQQPGDIGERMRKALAGSFASGASRTVLIGTDIPQLSSELLCRALRALDQKDLVFGPAADGGYYLIGAAARSFANCEPTLFRGIRWGSGSVLEQTLNRADSAGAATALVDRLTDVDRPSDLPAWIGRSRANSPAGQRPVISVIMPTLNEAGHIGAALASVPARSGLETIVVDGGSTDETVRLARETGARVYRTPASKAGQMNAGAALARGVILLFLHADTRLPPGFADQIRRVLARPGVAAGAFRLGIDAPGKRLRFIERVANLRSRFLQMPYGDQAIFTAAKTFAAVGGYPQQPIMEDFELVRRLLRRGKIAIAPSRVSTSPRRWVNRGVLKTWLVNQAIVCAYQAGISPESLSCWYRREKGRRALKGPFLRD